MTGTGKRAGGVYKAPANGTPGSRSARGGPTLDRVIQAQIGDRLRAMYGELAEQPVPDRLTAILNRIGAPGRESGS